MTKKNRHYAVIMAAILSLSIVLSGCGLKGDPVPPPNVLKMDAPTDSVKIKKDKEIQK